MMKMNQAHFTSYSNKPFSGPGSEVETLCLLLDSAYTDEIHEHAEGDGLWLQTSPPLRQLTEG